MQSDRTASANGHPVSPPGGSGSRTKLESLQAECRHQAAVIDALSEAVSTFRRGATALKAENAELRTEIVRLGERRRSPAGAAGRLADGDLVELAIALDTRAPGAARDFVVLCLEQRVVASALDSAQLLVSELVTNSFRHGGAPMDDVMVTVELMPHWFRVGVQDSGSDAVIAARPADLVTGGGFGLNLVQMLSERWGVERLAGGGTQVWAQLPRARGEAARGSDGNGSGRLASRVA
jgi:anti-sigma regulatory factor (Ser/Thr protein kinase)